jgi:hypothetical protein
MAANGGIRGNAAEPEYLIGGIEFGGVRLGTVP